MIVPPYNLTSAIVNAYRATVRSTDVYILEVSVLHHEHRLQYWSYINDLAVQKMWKSVP
jgi:hypothetical protein